VQPQLFESGPGIVSDCVPCLLLSIAAPPPGAGPNISGG